jgi:hypothetical protein
MEAEGRSCSSNACRLGLEGIVSKRKALVVSVRSLAGLGEGEEPNAPAVTRLAEEDWGLSWSSSGSRRPLPR